MPINLKIALDEAAKHTAPGDLFRCSRGIEKEALRITHNGLLAQTDHPTKLGSALTHSSITTDYSESLLEFITPVSNSIGETMRQLEDIHTFVYQNLDEELLRTASMPCALTADSDIPVARYGSSNSARLKTVYRYGLGHRYGRRMQTIAGIHYNFSLPNAFWPWLQSIRGDSTELSSFKTESYLGLIRNFQRCSWLLIYLFGASPAVCSTFLKGRHNHGLEPADPDHNSYHLPYATSLRMGGLGYNSDAQKSLQVCYNSLDAYIDTLRAAIVQPHAEYESFPRQIDGEYQQLSDCLLQIENEFYSPIRPKRVSRSGEPSLHALAWGGIEYIEVRCIDINPFLPVGIDETQIRFIDLFLLHCALCESPPCTSEEQELMAHNFSHVVTRGREPGLVLDQSGKKISLSQWGLEITDQLRPLAEALDGWIETGFVAALDAQEAKLRDSTLTPSHQVSELVNQGGFFTSALNQSRHQQAIFSARSLPPDTVAAFEEAARLSLEKQKKIEASDTISFETFLASFLAQYADTELHPKSQ